MGARVARFAWLGWLSLFACRSLPLSERDSPEEPGDVGAGGAPADVPLDPDSEAGGRGNATGGRRGDAGPGAPAEPSGAAPNDVDMPSAGEGNSVNEPGPFDGPARCTSNVFRSPNEEEGPTMNPGFPCITCHAAANAASSETDAPNLTFAGTLYPTAHEPNSCLGAAAENAEVVLMDASGAELRALANTSGNFRFEGAHLVAPFSVKVLFEGRERAATTPHQSGDCNLCHSQVGDQGAPGRVVLP